MINTSDKIILAPGANIQNEVCNALDTLCKLMRNEFGNKIDQALNSADRQARSRFSLFIFKKLKSYNKLNKNDLDLMYKLSVTDTKDGAFARSTYEKITGTQPVFIEDALGLRVSLRVMFVILWSKGIVTLPYTFELGGVWAKFPTLEPISKGFIYEQSQGFPETVRASRAFQYRTNWISSEHINFEELWDAAPNICDNRECDPKYFRYLPWIKRFAAKHPKILSPIDAYYLEKYHQYLQAKSTALISAHESKMSTEEFKDYFAVPPEDAVAMTPKHRERARRAYKSKWSQEKKAIRQQAKDKAITEQLEKGELTIEQLSMLTPRPERSSNNFEWLKNNYYTGREHIDIDKLSRHWLAAANYYLSYLERQNHSTNWRRAKVRTIKFLFDYLFCYIPMWIEANPHTVVRFPTRPSDFERILFWNNTLSLADLDDNIFGLQYSLSGVKLPGTLIQHYDMAYSTKTKAAFVANMHEFFEVIITDKALIKVDEECVIEKGFENPVSLLLDRSGSGARGSTDKVPLPLDSTVIAKAYLQAVEKVGITLQQQILTGKINIKMLDKIRQAEWINLSELGLSHSIQFKNPDDETDSIIIPLRRIINVYSWHSSLYGAATTEIYMPWISVVRMLSIALHGGLRLQNCQWLDINTFDMLLSKPENRILNSCLLHVNTDKDGQDRPVVIPDEVMESLIAERQFQREIYRAPLLPTYYENDPKDPKKYGAIYSLFRSPWNVRGLPFSDSNYSEKWTLLLHGIQDTYNEIVPLERKHQFVTHNKNGQMKSIHTPHSLRATWLTHNRIYGHLDIRVAQQQVAHKNRYTTDYYTIPIISESIKAISDSNNLVLRNAWAQIAPAANKIYNNSNSITSGWSLDRKKLAQDQNFISVTSAMIEHEKTGMQIIASDKDPDVGFYSNCICLRNGKCPKSLTDFTGRTRVCGLCPIAVFGIDHLPAINCLTRKLAGESENLVSKLKGLKASKANRHEIEAVHHDLTVTKLELGSYHLIRQALKDRLEQEKPEIGLISRMRDLKNFESHEIDMGNPAQRVIAQLLDSKDYPHFTSHNYPYMIEKVAKNPDLLKIAIAQGSDRDRYVGQILSIMTTMNLSLPDIAERFDSKALALSDQP